METHGCHKAKATSFSAYFSEINKTALNLIFSNSSNLTRDEGILTDVLSSSSDSPQDLLLQQLIPSSQVFPSTLNEFPCPSLCSSVSFPLPPYVVSHLRKVEKQNSNIKNALETSRNKKEEKTLKRNNNFICKSWMELIFMCIDDCIYIWNYKNTCAEKNKNLSSSSIPNPVVLSLRVSRPIQQIDICKPHSNVFASEISFILVVCTDMYLQLYGIIFFPSIFCDLDSYVSACDVIQEEKLEHIIETKDIRNKCEYSYLYQDNLGKGGILLACSSLEEEDVGRIFIEEEGEKRNKFLFNKNNQIDNKDKKCLKKRRMKNYRNIYVKIVNLEGYIANTHNNIYDVINYTSDGFIFLLNKNNLFYLYQLVYSSHDSLLSSKCYINRISLISSFFFDFAWQVKSRRKEDDGLRNFFRSMLTFNFFSSCSTFPIKIMKCLEHNFLFIVDVYNNIYVYSIKKLKEKIFQKASFSAKKSLLSFFFDKSTKQDSFYAQNASFAFTGCLDKVIYEEENYPLFCNADLNSDFSSSASSFLFPHLSNFYYLFSPSSPRKIKNLYLVLFIPNYIIIPNIPKFRDNSFLHNIINIFPNFTANKNISLSVINSWGLCINIGINLNYEYLYEKLKRKKCEFNKNVHEFIKNKKEELLKAKEKNESRDRKAKKKLILKEIGNSNILCEYHMYYNKFCNDFHESYCRKFSIQSRTFYATNTSERENNVEKQKKRRKAEEQEETENDSAVSANSNKEEDFDNNLHVYIHKYFDVCISNVLQAKLTKEELANIFDFYFENMKKANEISEFGNRNVSCKSNNFLSYNNYACKDNFCVRSEENFISYYSNNLFLFGCMISCGRTSAYSSLLAKSFVNREETKQNVEMHEKNGAEEENVFTFSYKSCIPRNFNELERKSNKIKNYNGLHNKEFIDIHPFIPNTDNNVFCLNENVLCIKEKNEIFTAGGAEYVYEKTKPEGFLYNLVRSNVNIKSNYDFNFYNNKNNNNENSSSIEAFDLCNNNAMSKRRIIIVTNKNILVLKFKDIYGGYIKRNKHSDMFLKSINEKIEIKKNFHKDFFSYMNNPLQKTSQNALNHTDNFLYVDFPARNVVNPEKSVDNCVISKYKSEEKFIKKYKIFKTMQKCFCIFYISSFYFYFKINNYFFPSNFSFLKKKFNFSIHAHNDNDFPPVLLEEEQKYIFSNTHTRKLLKKIKNENKEKDYNDNFMLSSYHQSLSNFNEAYNDCNNYYSYNFDISAYSKSVWLNSICTYTYIVLCDVLNVSIMNCMYLKRCDSEYKNISFFCNHEEAPLFLYTTKCAKESIYFTFKKIKNLFLFISFSSLNSTLKEVTQSDMPPWLSLSTSFSSFFSSSYSPSFVALLNSSNYLYGIQNKHMFFVIILIKILSEITCVLFCLSNISVFLQHDIFSKTIEKFCVEKGKNLFLKKTCEKRQISKVKKIINLCSDELTESSEEEVEHELFSNNNNYINNSNNSDNNSNNSNNNNTNNAFFVHKNKLIHTLICAPLYEYLCSYDLYTFFVYILESLFLYFSSLSFSLDAYPEENEEEKNRNVKLHRVFNVCFPNEECSSYIKEEKEMIFKEFFLKKIVEECEWLFSEINFAKLVKSWLDKNVELILHRIIKEGEESKEESNKMNKSYLNVIRKIAKIILTLVEKCKKHSYKKEQKEDEILCELYIWFFTKEEYKLALDVTVCMFYALEKKQETSTLEKIISVYGRCFAFFSAKIKLENSEGEEAKRKSIIFLNGGGSLYGKEKVKNVKFSAKEVRCLSNIEEYLESQEQKKSEIYSKKGGKDNRKSPKKDTFDEFFFEFKEDAICIVMNYLCGKSRDIESAKFHKQMNVEEVKKTAATDLESSFSAFSFKNNIWKRLINSSDGSLRLNVYEKLAWEVLDRIIFMYERCIFLAKKKNSLSCFTENSCGFQDATFLHLIERTFFNSFICSLFFSSHSLKMLLRTYLHIRVFNNQSLVHKFLLYYIYMIDNKYIESCSLILNLALFLNESDSKYISIEDSVVCFTTAINLLNRFVSLLKKNNHSTLSFENSDNKNATNAIKAEEKRLIKQITSLLSCVLCADDNLIKQVYHNLNVFELLDIIISNVINFKNRICFFSLPLYRRILCLYEEEKEYFLAVYRNNGDMGNGNFTGAPCYVSSEVELGASLMINKELLNILKIPLSLNYIYEIASTYNIYDICIKTLIYDFYMYNKDYFSSCILSYENAEKTKKGVIDVEVQFRNKLVANTIYFLYVLFFKSINHAQESRNDVKEKKEKTRKELLMQEESESVPDKIVELQQQEEGKKNETLEHFIAEEIIKILYISTKNIKYANKINYTKYVKERIENKNSSFFSDNSFFFVNNNENRMQLLDEVCNAHKEISYYNNSYNNINDYTNILDSLDCCSYSYLLSSSSTSTKNYIFYTHAFIDLCIWLWDIANPQKNEPEEEVRKEEQVYERKEEQKEAIKEEIIDAACGRGLGQVECIFIFEYFNCICFYSSIYDIIETNLNIVLNKNKFQNSFSKNFFFNKCASNSYKRIDNKIPETKHNEPFFSSFFSSCFFLHCAFCPSFCIDWIANVCFLSLEETFLIYENFLMNDNLCACTINLIKSCIKSFYDNKLDTLIEFKQRNNNNNNNCNNICSNKDLLLSTHIYLFLSRVDIQQFKTYIIFVLLKLLYSCISEIEETLLNKNNKYIIIKRKKDENETGANITNLSSSSVHHYQAFQENQSKDAHCDNEHKEKQHSQKENLAEKIKRINRQKKSLIALYKSKHLLHFLDGIIDNTYNIISCNNNIYNCYYDNDNIIHNSNYQTYNSFINSYEYLLSMHSNNKKNSANKAEDWKSKEEKSSKKEMKINEENADATLRKEEEIVAAKQKFFRDKNENLYILNIEIEKNIKYFAKVIRKKVICLLDTIFESN